MISLAQTIAQRIDQLAEDVSFGYDQLGLSKEQYQTAAKAPNRLQQKGIIRKISKGRFYPKQTLYICYKQM
ncbi:hypothetical protein C5O19_18685 [Siphonobacter curvatus]|uniref:Uncharacterized protein n=1 Tax=Siphonobacter curvatus TaxID=2094562 RepID=A0A2S7IJC4_9BACT|nr:hypothetical protein C5O19_18685 [Siphonobacter curvatus]